MALLFMIWLGIVDRTVEVGSLEGVERRIGVQFPPGARLIEARYETAGLNADLMARVEMRRDELHGFLSAGGFGACSTSDKGLLDPKYGNAMAMRTFETGKTRCFVSADTSCEHPTASCHVLADLDDSSVAIVYLWWFVL